ncbi:MAG TPA: Flp family type IVb pilin [Solirubrobacteraceae bacterium]
MTALIRFLYIRLICQRGQTMGEYAILVAWVALLVIVGATKLGSSLSHAFSTTATKI